MHRWLASHFWQLRFPSADNLSLLTSCTLVAMEKSWRLFIYIYMNTYSHVPQGSLFLRFPILTYFCFLSCVSHLSQRSHVTLCCNLMCEMQSNLNTKQKSQKHLKPPTHAVRFTSPSNWSPFCKEQTKSSFFAFRSHPTSFLLAA